MYTLKSPESTNKLSELTRKYLHGIEIGGAKAGAIYGVIPRYFKLENLKLDETGTIDVDVESHMCINPSDLMISVIIKERNQTLSEFKKQQFYATPSSDERLQSVVVVVHLGKAIGTGFFVRDDLVLTNYHVTEGTNFVQQWRILGERDVQGRRSWQTDRGRGH